MTMLLCPRHCSTVADLLRLLAVWLALALLVQGIAAANAMARGPLHRHALVSAAGVHDHGGAERHVHAADDATVLPVAGAEDALDAAAFALTAALALLAVAGLRTSQAPSGHVQRPATPWQLHPAWQALLHRPPRFC
jgi:hypothetical protein